LLRSRLPYFFISGIVSYNHLPHQSCCGFAAIAPVCCKHIASSKFWKCCIIRAIVAPSNKSLL
ncbi:hypothetical protein, partial [uncultured Nostoc sp.]|uniref:hypothetical protein n=1 Tax=uncultured Nostoc sp. TaxID=340711 RepID=UPI0035CADD9F